MRARTDRRGEKTRAFRVGPPAFIRVSKPIAAGVIACVALVALVADYYSPPQIWYGPVYLMICAFAAWFTSAPMAVLLGTAILTFQTLSGNHVGYPHGSGIAASDIALKFFSVLAVVLMLSQARASLEREWRLARTDPLTGALNRQAFFETMKADANRNGPAMLVFADVDGLKRLNDLMGHEKGDEGLCHLAGRIRGAIRKVDLFARIGGDEFVLFMKVRDEAAAKLVAERLDAVLNREEDREAGILTCSLGALFLPLGSQSIDRELRLADGLMYSAKKSRAGFAVAAVTAGDLQDDVWTDEHGNPRDRSTCSGGTRSRNLTVGLPTAQVVH